MHVYIITYLNDMSRQRIINANIFTCTHRIFPTAKREVNSNSPFLFC